MKIALLLPANIYFCPYAMIYTKILDELKIKYDIIAWDRVNIGEKGGIFFTKYLPYNKGNRIKWLISYIAYSRFLKKNIKKKVYDRLVVFSPQVGLFLYPTLKSKYNKRFCFDYRDIFIEQLFPRLFFKLLSISKLNIISSPGFLSFIPKEFNYVLSHNFDIDVLNNNSIKQNFNTFKKEPIVITTIGAIRDYDQNFQLMEALSNIPHYKIKFIGTPGTAGEKLHQDVIKNNIYNVEFKGYYEKKDEPSLINDADFLNIYYPKINSHSTALSNRFYTALIFKKPVIVTKDSIQGNYVDKYNLGIAIENCLNLDAQIQNFILNFNQEEFINNCNKLLIEFRSDYDVFKENFIKFLS